MSILAEILSSKVRAEFFKILFGINQKECHLREIERLSGFSIGAVRKEAMKLLRLQLIVQRIDGNRTYYKANKSHPIYKIIHDLVLQTVGLVDIFNQSLDSKSISFAFIFGSIAKGTEKSDSDIDLFVIGSLSLRDLTKQLKEPSKILNREINPHVMSTNEFCNRINRNDNFIKNIIDSPKIMLIGKEDELRKLV